MSPSTWLVLIRINCLSANHSALFSEIFPFYISLFLHSVNWKLHCSQQIRFKNFFHVHYNVQNKNKKTYFAYKTSHATLHNRLLISAVKNYRTLIVAMVTFKAMLPFALRTLRHLLQSLSYRWAWRIGHLYDEVFLLSRPEFIFKSQWGESDKSPFG